MIRPSYGMKREITAKVAPENEKSSHKNGIKVSSAYHITVSLHYED